MENDENRDENTEQTVTDIRIDRRTFLTAGALAGVAGLLAPGLAEATEALTPLSSDPEAIAAALRDNVYTQLLGVRPHIGAHEHLSRLSGSRMPDEVIRAMTEANRFFVDMHELTRAAGKRIAEIMGAEDAVVTSGGFSALMIGGAASLTGTDPEKIKALPFPTWPKQECLFQKAHRFVYDPAFRYVGMKIVEADTRKAFEEAITDRTALLVGLAFIEKQNEVRPPFPVKRRAPRPSETLLPEEIIEIGNRKGIPVLIDMASDLPPVSNLTRFIKAGADLVAVSGGKAVRGPNSTGFLAGRKDLIEAARLHNAPNGGIGRGMKVGKEEIMGLIAALNRYIALDEPAMIAAWGRKAQWLSDQLQGIPGVRAEYAVNTFGYADVELTWDQKVFPLSRDEVKKRLKDGDPSIV
ncbi:MAG: hypothetical protein FJY97_14295 [candidate division Zixibacteria bacterium]|nr:hypothetical protein [candidate division Zixibacteria bacterium]